MDGDFLELELDIVRHFEHHEILLDLHDLAQYSAGGDDFVPFRQSGDHRRVLLLALALGTDSDEVEKREEADEKYNLEDGAAGGRLLRRSLGVGLRNKEAHGMFLFNKAAERPGFKCWGGMRKGRTLPGCQKPCNLARCCWTTHNQRRTVSANVVPDFATSTKNNERGQSMDRLNRISIPIEWAPAGQFSQLLTDLAQDFDRRARRKCHARGYPKVRSVHLALIGHIGPATLRLSELAMRAGVSQQAVGKLVRELERNGYIETAVTAEDRRARYVSLSGRGLALAREFEQIIQEVRSDYLDLIGPNVVQSLERSLRQAAQALRLPA